MAYQNGLVAPDDGMTDRYRAGDRDRDTDTESDSKSKSEQGTLGRSSDIQVFDI